MSYVLNEIFCKLKENCLESIIDSYCLLQNEANEGECAKVGMT